MNNMALNPKPFNEDFLDEQDGHRVFFSQYGNKDGEAIIILHGGPGSQSKPKQVKGYDLKKYHLITFDQRGCGRSEPAGKTNANSLNHLIGDIERLRTRLKINTWFVAGGSWGATLALAYAQTHPKQTKGLLLSSIFLARKRDVDWAFTANGGVERLFPDVWEDRLEFLNTYQTTPVNAAKKLLQRLDSASFEDAKIICAGVSNWEGNLMNAQEDIQYFSADEVDESDVASTRIFLHYEANHFFLEPNQLVDQIGKIKTIPTIIVHGRYDVLCPIEEMWTVQKQLTHVELLILPTSNHKLTAEGEIARKLAFTLFLNKLSG